jgi:hypothetical protein
VEVERDKVQRNLAEVHPMQKKDERLDGGEVEDGQMVALNRQAPVNLHDLCAFVGGVDGGSGSGQREGQGRRL